MFLGLDLGTTNVKAEVADAGGAILARGAAPAAPATWAAFAASASRARAERSNWSMLSTGPPARW